MGFFKGRILVIKLRKSMQKIYTIGVEKTIFKEHFWNT